MQVEPATRGRVTLRECSPTGLVPPSEHSRLARARQFESLVDSTTASVHNRRRQGFPHHSCRPYKLSVRHIKPSSEALSQTTNIYQVWLLGASTTWAVILEPTLGLKYRNYPARVPLVGATWLRGLPWPCGRHAWESSGSSGNSRAAPSVKTPRKRGERPRCNGISSPSNPGLSSGSSSRSGTRCDLAPTTSGRRLA